MALEFFTGFDHYATADLTLGVTSRFTSVQNASIQTTTFRNGSRALNLSSGSASDAKKTGFGNNVTHVLGFGFQSEDVLGSQNPGLVFAAISDGDPESGVVNIGLALDSSAKLEVYRGRLLGATTGGTKLGSSSTNALSSNTWYFIELVITVNNSTGTVEVFVNNTKSGWIDLSSQDTQSGSNAYSNAFGFGGLTAGENVFFDDVYFLSGSGGSRTTRLGDVKAVAVVASSGDGAVAEFTPLTGTDNGAMVDETTPNGNTDYNESTSVGNIDTYAFAALGSVGTIYGLNLHNYTQKTDAGTCDAQGVARISSTNYLQTQRGQSTSYGYNTDLLEQSPATAADFTPSEINGAEFGIKHAA